MLRTLPIAALFMLLLAPILIAQQSGFDTATCPCTLRGIVIDSVTNQPVRNVLVSLLSNTSVAVFSDADGRFEFNSLAAGPTIILLSKPNYLPGAIFGNDSTLRKFVQIAPDAAPVVVKFTPESVIFGQVTDESGEPLEGFSLDLYFRNTVNHQIIHTSMPTITDDEGRFRIAGLRPGNYYIGVHQESFRAATSSANSQSPLGYAPAIYPNAADLSSATPLHIAAGTQTPVNFSLKLVPYIRLSGTISGAPSPKGVQLTLFNAFSKPVPAQCHVDPSTFAFQCANVPPGIYTLTAAITRAALDTGATKLSVSKSIIASADVSGIYLPLAPSSMIPIYLHRSSNNFPEAHFQPPNLLLISLSPIGNSGFYPAQPSSSPGDVLTFRDVPPGSYVLSAMNSSDYYVESAASGPANLLHDPLVVGSSGTTPPVQISLVDRAATLSGTVTLEGQNAPALVLLFHSDSQRQPEVQTASEEGRFAFHGLAPDTYRILAVNNVGSIDFSNPASRARLSSQMLEITLSAAQNATISLEIAQVPE